MSVSPGIDREPIRDDDVLWRRVPFKNPRYVKPDQTLTSSSFTPRWKHGEKDLSVNVKRLSTHEASIKDPELYRLYSLKAEYVRSIDLCVCHDPCPNEEPANAAHVLIRSCHDVQDDCLGERMVDLKIAPPKITESYSRRMAQTAQLVRYLPEE